MNYNYIEYKRGQKVGNCTFIIDPISRNKIRHAIFECPKCNRYFNARISAVKCGNTSTCGCTKVRGAVKHGMSKHILYPTWCSIIARCYNSNSRIYKYYGGRNISMCDEWKNNPISFFNYVKLLDNYRRDGYSIDRINNDGNYEPGNLRWATQREQMLNSRHNCKGVFRTGHRYYSRIRVNNIIYRLGSFKTEREGILARDKFIIEHSLTKYKLQILEIK